MSTATTTSGTPAARGVRPTEPAPELAVPLLRGGTYRLADQRPGLFTMVVVFWVVLGLIGEKPFAITRQVLEPVLLHAVEQSFGSDVGGKLPTAHDDATERSVFGCELVIADTAVVEQTVLRHDKRNIRRCAKPKNAGAPWTYFARGAPRNDLIRTQRRFWERVQIRCRAA